LSADRRWPSFLRLIVVSFVVGIFLETFGFDPVSLFNEASAH
jgi:hypothetical protein